MTAQSAAHDFRRAVAFDRLDPVGQAREHVTASALRDHPAGLVGLELELHLVDLRSPAIRPTWQRVLDLVASLPPMPCGSAVTVEPGGQVELSTPPVAGAPAAVAALRTDLAVLRSALAGQGHGAAGLGTDPARAAHRTNPHPRYAAMERHFDALGCAGPGRSMMSATAALQVNLDAGPAAGWAARLDLVRSLVPVLVALSAASPYLSGRTSGWHSMRQQVWQGIDPRRAGALPEGGPAEAWARYALDAPVMLVRDAEEVRPVTQPCSFATWLVQPDRLGRPATPDDLDYHLTTLFPPVRPRGYLEIRCLDALPDRWWPALAALTVTLVDDSVAADRASELCRPVAGAGESAARHGLADPALRTAVVGCVEVATSRCPDTLRPDLEALAELVASGRTPGDELRARARTHGPLRLLEEEAHA